MGKIQAWTSLAEENATIAQKVAVSFPADA